MKLNFEIGFSDEAKKDFKKLSKKDAERIFLKASLLNNYLNNNNVKKLSGELGDYFRLRMGKLRLIFEVDNKARRIKVVEVAFRKEVYR
ncbi:type II toxin-antitoxin system RelE/ParE family toxin [Patescibacteria group bacterium]|nr:type II toxin-antitoxin system RelE/ParE family toxin [Patescibacteria group bacterium]